MIKTYTFSQTFITALVEFKLVELGEKEGMELLIAPTSLLACEDSSGFFNNFPNSRTWRNYFVTSLLIRIPSYHSVTGNLVKIYFMTRNKVEDNCIVVPSGYIIAAKDASSNTAVNEGYYHYEIDHNIDVSQYVSGPNVISSDITDALLEKLTSEIASKLFTVIKKYYM